RDAQEGGQGASAAMRQRMQERFQQQFAGFRAMLDAPQRAQWDAAIAGLASARRAPLYRLANGAPERVTVRVGASDGSNTEVAGNLREGERVIVGARSPTPKPAP
ncbi:MAG TPA: efflux RND transporter periplasmic adaptor subunit, partial [Xanthomonadaceae bacterium]|nr:efflux RND transporter periplasmic adaptor subunit [Xanthomonadaceae bacterium]